MDTSIFYFLAVKNKAAMNFLLQVFVWTYGFNSFGYIPWTGIAGLYGNSVWLFEEQLHYFLSWLHHFIFPQHCMKILVFLHPHKYLLIPILKITAML